MGELSTLPTETFRTLGAAVCVPPGVFPEPPADPVGVFGVLLPQETKAITMTRASKIDPNLFILLTSFLFVIFIIVKEPCTLTPPHLCRLVCFLHRIPEHAGSLPVCFDLSGSELDAHIAD